MVEHRICSPLLRSDLVCSDKSSMSDRRAIVCLDKTFHLILESLEILRRDRAGFYILLVDYGGHFICSPVLDRYWSSCAISARKSRSLSRLINPSKTHSCDVIALLTLQTPTDRIRCVVQGSEKCDKRLEVVGIEENLAWLTVALNGNRHEPGLKFPVRDLLIQDFVHVEQVCHAVRRMFL